MKNRVLRLAIVAILVVAMVLTVAACGEKKPAPTQAPAPTKAPTQAPTQAPTKAPTQAPTKAPTQAPTQAPTEAPVADPYDAFVEKYGITFPVEVKHEGAKKANLYDTTNFEFVPSFDNATDLYKAIDADIKANANNASFEISGKVVSAVNFEGKKIDSDTYGIVDATTSAPSYFKAKNAGTYTVNWTVKVSESGDVAYGIYNVPKFSETITFTKTYVINKASAEIKALAADVYLQVSNAPVYVIDDINTVITVAPVEVAKYLEDEEITVGKLITVTDQTVAGEFIVPIVVKNDKGVEIDPATLVFPNYNVTFTNGKLIVYTAEQKLAADAAADRVAFAVGKKDAYALAIAEVEALDAVEKALFNAIPAKEGETLTPAKKLENITKDIADSAMDPKVAEAKALADAWFNSLKAADKLEAFNAFVVGLTAKEVDYVYAAIKDVANYSNLLDGTYKFAVLKDRATAKATASADAATKIAAAMTAGQAAINAMAQNTYSTEELIAAADAAIAAADAVLDKYISAGQGDNTKKDYAAGKATYAEYLAKYNAILSLVEGLDAYIAGGFMKGEIEALIGYDFDVKDITKALSDVASSAAYQIYHAPIYYKDAIVAAYAKVVADYDKFNDALVSAVADVKTLVATDMALYTKKVSSVNVEALTIVEAASGKELYKALQDYIVTTAKAAFEVEKESIAKKGIDEVIARSLKDAVKAVADFVEEFEYVEAE